MVEIITSTRIKTVAKYVDIRLEVIMVIKVISNGNVYNYINSKGSNVSWWELKLICKSNLSTSDDFSKDNPTVCAQTSIGFIEIISNTLIKPVAKYVDKRLEVIMMIKVIWIWQCLQLYDNSDSVK